MEHKWKTLLSLKEKSSVHWHPAIISFIHFDTRSFARSDSWPAVGNARRASELIVYAVFGTMPR